MNLGNSSKEAILKEILSRNFYTFRSTFYLLTPNETYYKNVDDVPDLTGQVRDLAFETGLSFRTILYFSFLFDIRHKGRKYIRFVYAGRVFD